MKKTSPILLAMTFLVAATAPAVASDSLHIGHSVFQAEKNNQKHPLTLTRTILINQAVEKPRICVAYDNTLSRSRGKVVTRIEINRQDGTQEMLTMAEKVRKNSVVKCSKAGQVSDLSVDDMLVFEFEFQRMLRLKRNSGRTDHVNLYAVAVADGFPLPLDTVGVTLSEKDGGWLHSANFNFQAEEDKQKHPVGFTKMIIMPRDAESPLLCSAYRHTLAKENQGQVSVEARITREDENVETITFSGKIRKGEFKKCKAAEDLVVGDVVEFEFEFADMPRLRKTSDRTDHAEASGVVSTNGEPDFASDPDVEGGSPSPDNPRPTGGLSSADQVAAAKLLIGSKPSQLWRFKGDQPRKWTVVGPNTLLGDGLGSLNPGTAGYGNTIAEAVADYEKKRGGLSSGGSLSSADVAALVWYSGINSSAGPTSIRRDRSGGYHGEYYRPGRGAVHTGPYPSIAKAVDWLKSQGL